MANFVSSSSNIQLDPLHNESNITALTTLAKVIKTSIGPKGKLKIIQNIAGGHVTVTSISQRLFHNVSIKNTLLKLLVSSVKIHLKSYNDGGLYCCLLITELMKNSLNLSYPLPLIGRLYETFGKLYIDCLNSENNSCKLNLNLSKLSDLQAFISSILNSKPGCTLTDEDKLHMSTILLKAFLNIIPQTDSLICKEYRINIMTLEGINARQSTLYDGLFIRNTEAAQIALGKLKRTTNLKTVLYTVSLSGDIDLPSDTIEICCKISIWETAVKYLLNISKKLIDMDTDVVACQKVIHPKVRKHLEDNRILVLDRLGVETAKHLEFLLGVPSISSLSVTDIPYGTISYIREELIGKHQFLLLHSEEKPLSTILVCNYNEEALQETKHVCQQVIDALFRLLQNQKVCYGAGCTEIFTCQLLEEKVRESLTEISEDIGCSSFQVLEIFNIFQQSMFTISLAFHQGSLLEFISETKYHHLWKLQDGNFPVDAKCMCGTHYAKSVNSSDWKFLTKSSTYNFEKMEGNTEIIHSVLERNLYLILDELACKISASSVAFETASMLMRVSLCISSSS